MMSIHFTQSIHAYVGFLLIFDSFILHQFVVVVPTCGHVTGWQRFTGNVTEPAVERNFFRVLDPANGFSLRA
jgi:hypothetical protein